jgi:5-methylcytosine-specific restriction endonuclease McrA
MEAVYKRDSGKSVEWGAYPIHFDNKIPVALGGDSAVHNVQILCKRRNRKEATKSASIAALQKEGCCVL